MSLEITKNNIKEVLENTLVVIDFWAPWCAPCRMLGPIIDQLSVDNPDIIIGKVNVDNESSLSVEYGIRNIPILLFFKDGILVDKINGITSKQVIQKKMDDLK